MLTVLRFLFVLPFGFVAATLAAAFAMLSPFIGPLRADDPVFWLDAAVAFTAQAAQIGSVALLPWCAFVFLTEVLGLSSILVHLGAGLLGGAAVLYGVYGPALPGGDVQTAVMVAALVFALVYWLIAGRSAGRWRRRSIAPDPAAPVR